ncbi:MAG: hypothetical protein ACSLEL_00725 [Candidatus Malihini olakiniferum]
MCRIAGFDREKSVEGVLLEAIFHNSGCDVTCPDMSEIDVLRQVRKVRAGYPLSC